MRRRNAAHWMGLATVQGFSGSFLSADLFNTVLIRLGATDFVLGLFALNQLVSLPAQFVAARVLDGSRHKVRIAWLSVTGGVLPVVLPWTVLAVTGGDVAMWTFFAAVCAHYILSQVSGAFNGVAQMDLLSRVLRPERRGTLFGFQASASGLAGIGGGLLLRPALHGLLVAVVARMGFSATQYYIWPTAKRLHGLPDEYAGYLASVNAAIAMVSAPGIGWLADRLGPAGTALAFSLLAAVGFCCSRASTRARG